jgi:FkbM family methyltransferase
MTLLRSQPVWIFGAGSFGRAVAEALSEAGFIVAGFVQSSPSDAMLDGRPVFGWDEVARRAAAVQIVLGIFNREVPYDRLVTLAQAAGFSRVHMPWEIYALVGDRLGWRYWLSAPSSLRQLELRLCDIEGQLADEISRNAFRRIVRFRLGEDLAWSSFRHPEEQYFNAITLADPQLLHGAYVDCGAYDGDTYLRYREVAPTSGRAFLLEPDPGNFRRLVERTEAFGNNVQCLPIAAAAQRATLRFASSSGEASAIDPSGSVSVEAVPLDQLLVGERVGFLKLDVEGAEKDALHGAKDILATSRPVIAMSLYHRPEDLCELPEVLFGFCEDYSFYVRQHYFNSFDCVLYGIPNR